MKTQNKKYAVYLTDNTGTPHSPVYFDHLDDANWYVNFILPKSSFILHLIVKDEFETKEILFA